MAVAADVDLVHVHFRPTEVGLASVLQRKTVSVVMKSIAPWMASGAHGQSGRSVTGHAVSVNDGVVALVLLPNLEANCALDYLENMNSVN